MTRFPPDFQFSQSSLTDAAECLRRFQLRHVLRQEWPAPLIEPLRDAENEARLGEQFHHMAERYYLGLPILPPGDARLRGWFDALRQTEAVLNLPKTIRQPEATYSVALSTRRLMARFDLLAIEPGKRIVIVDWKTGRRRPEPAMLRARMQTRVYLYVAARALERVFGGPVPMRAITLVYWFTAAPEEPIAIQFDRDEDFRALTEPVPALISDIERRSEGIWPLTEDVTRCRRCNYRSLCERPLEPASLDDLDALDGEGLPDWSHELIPDVEL